MQTRRTDSRHTTLTDPLTYVSIAVLIVLPMLLLLSACAHPAAQPADAPAPQVTVAEVISRDVTEWDEVTRPPRSGQYGCRPPPRVGVRLRGAVHGRRDRSPRRPAVPDRSASIRGRGRS